LASRYENWLFEPDPQVLDVGKLTTIATDLILRDPDTGGLSSDRATPVLMHAVMVQLLGLTAKAKKMLDRAAPSVTYGWAFDTYTMLVAEYYAWERKLMRYFEKVNECMASDPTDPKCVYYCVTAPLLLGWPGNEDCTDIDPNVTQQQFPEIGTPFVLMNEIARFADFRQDHKGIGEFFATYLEVLVDTLADAGEAVAGAAVAGVKLLFEETTNALAQRPKVAITTALILAAAGGITYWYVTK